MPETVASSEERIPIGVVGLNFGRHIVDTQLRTGAGTPFFRLAALCDMDAGRASGLASALGLKAYHSLDGLLSDSSIPAIALYTGPSGRAELLRKIIRAGKDVMTTKPFEDDPEAARSVLAEAQSLGRTIHLNSPAPVLPPDLTQIKEWQQQYDLGHPVACRSDVWVHYREKADGTWYDDPRKCPAAPILRLGIYAINDLVALFGEAERVQVLSSRLFTARPTMDNAQLGVGFKSGAIANVFASFCVDDGDHYRNSLVLNFERGTVYRNTGPVRQDPAAEQSELSLIVREEGRRRVAEQTIISPSGQYRWDVFYRVIRGQRVKNLLPPAVIVDGLRIVRAMAEAERAGGCARVR